MGFPIAQYIPYRASVDPSYSIDPADDLEPIAGQYPIRVVSARTGKSS